MACSEAQLLANKANSLKSKGPSSPQGRRISSLNSTKHGLTGQGIVVAEDVAEEVELRVEALQAEMKPTTSAGAMLLRKIAFFSVRSELAADHENATIARNVRHAADDFDEARIDQARALLGGLADDPRHVLRKLKKMPEGIDVLIEAWGDLRDDLTADPEPVWGEEQLARAANLLGIRERHARASRLGALSRGFWSDFSGLEDTDGGQYGPEQRRIWAYIALTDRIAAEIAALEAHRATLDFETIAIDRAEAGARALFDDSKPACLARRYEAEANRGFFRALAEYRKVEAESAARKEASPSPLKPEDLFDDPAPASKMGSFRQPTPPPVRNPAWDHPDFFSTNDSIARGPDSQPLQLTPGPKPTA